MTFEPYKHRASISENMFQFYAEKFPCAMVLTVDRHGKVAYCNRLFCETTGYRPEEVVRLAASKFIPDSMEELERSYFTAALRDETLTVSLVAKSGETLSLQCTYINAEMEGESYRILIFHDKRHIGELNLLQQFSGAFIRDVNLGVILLDMNFRLMDISEMACRVLGLVREDVLNRPIHEVFAGMPIEHQLVQRALLDGVIVRNHAVTWMNNQERYELLMDSNLLRDDKGNTVGAYVIFKDVTNLRSLEEQMQRSDRLAMIGQIAAGTAHEIRNPLTSIRGFLQMFKKTLRDKGMSREYSYTEVMLSEIDRINELVSEFLLLSKPKDITFDHVDVVTVINEMLPIITNEALLHDVSVHFHPAGSLPRIVADRELLKQVFLNICKNGIEAMTEGGTLTITVRADTDSDSKVLIEVHDTGPGIPAFLIDKIFDPFFTTKENGTGLGLSVCQRIVHDHGGSLRVSSKGFGTTFTISIPYDKEFVK